MFTKTNSAKKLLLTATFLTPLLLALASTTFAQDAGGPNGDTQTQSSDDSASTAKELGNSDFGNDDNDIDDVLSGDPTDAPIMNDSWTVEQGDRNSPNPYAPTGEFTATFIKLVSHDCYFWRVIEYVNVYTQESTTVEIELGYDRACDDPKKTAEESGDEDMLGGLPGDEPLILPPEESSESQHALPPGVAKESSIDVPKKDGTDQKTSSADAPHQVGMTTPREKHATSATASVDHAARIDRHTAVSTAASKTSAATAMRSHAKTMEKVGHSSLSASRMASVGHASGMHVGGMSNFNHLGGMMHGGGMHLGGGRMGMR
jgi:hypothetical protein